MTDEVNKILAKLEEGEYIRSKDLKHYVAEHANEEDPAILKWKERTKKAKTDPYYRQGVYLACRLSGRTPSEIIQDVYDDIKEHGKPRRANELAIDIATVLKRLGKTTTTPAAPRTAGGRMSGFMSFISNVSGYRLSANVRREYKGFKNVTHDHITRYQLTSADLFEIIDHCDTTEKALIGFLASTGVSRIDIQKMTIPKGFFNSIKTAEKENYPAPKIAPMVHFYYIREKTGEYGYLWLAGDFLKAWMDYAKAKELKEGEPFFIGHNRAGLGEEAVYTIVTKASKRAGKRITPKQLREYLSGCLKDEGVNPDIIDIVTAHRSGELGEAYTAKHRLAKAYMKIWKYINPYLAREAKAIEVEKENKSLREDLEELRARFEAHQKLVIDLLTNKGDRAGLFKEIVGGEENPLEQ